MKKSITLRFDSELIKVIEKRAKENFLSSEELVEDIVRRSMISYKEGENVSKIKCDDALIDIFSREKRRKRRAKKKK